MGMVVWVGGVDTDGNTAGNWNPARVPTAGDVAHYDGVSDVNCTFSGVLSCDGIQADAGYSGNIDLGAGAITLGADGAVFDHTGDLTATSGTWSIAGDLDIEDFTGDWDNNSGTIQFSDDATVKVRASDRTLWHVIIDTTKTVTLGGSQNVLQSGTLSLIGSATLSISTGLRWDLAFAKVDLDTSSTITGAGEFRIDSATTSSRGVNSLGGSATIDVATMRLTRWTASGKLVPGTYSPTTFLIDDTDDNNTVKPQTGTFTFEGDFKLSATKGNDVELDGTNDIDYVFKNSVLNDESSGTTTWTKGTNETITFS